MAKQDRDRRRPRGSAQAAATEALAIARQLGPAFQVGSEPAGTERLPVLVHLPTAYELVLVPGGTFEMGLTARDVAAFRHYFDAHDTQQVQDGDEPTWAQWLEIQGASARPSRQVFVETFAMGRRLLLPAELGRLGHEDPSSSVSAEAAGLLARRAGFRLPTEAEWELVAREARTLAFLLDAAAVYFDDEIEREETSAGIGTLGAGEWTEDCWHPTFAHAPATSAAWREGGVGRVARGFAAGRPETEADVAAALIALRTYDGAAPRCRPFRLALSADAQGRWSFPLER